MQAPRRGVAVSDVCPVVGGSALYTDAVPDFIKFRQLIIQGGHFSIRHTKDIVRIKLTVLLFS